MPRNNQRRTKSAPTPTATEDTAQKSSVLNFVTPTEFVNLPSKGRFYPPDHPFHHKETVEIRYMTAKDEDILTNQTLLRNGVALERLLENILSDNDVDPGTLLVGDRNAIIVATRTTGYGPTYNTNITCPACQTKVKHSFDLSDPAVTTGIEDANVKITETGQGTFTVDLPLTKVTAEMRLLTGHDEVEMGKTLKDDKNTILDNMFTSQLERLIVSLNGESDPEVISKFVQMMPAYDSRYLREAHTAVTPDIDLTQNFKCPNCQHEQEMGVPFTVDFFWPNR